MSLRTVLVHVDHGRRCQKRVEIAAALASRHGAQLLGVAPTGLPTASGSDVLEASYGRHATAFRRERAKLALDRFSAWAGMHAVPDCETWLVEQDPARAIAVVSACADLVVVSRFDPEDATTPADFVEQVLRETACPVLVVPPGDDHGDIGRRVLVAWDASQPASRAVREAMPILERASAVRLMTVNARAGDDARAAGSGADLADLLARRDIVVDVTNATMQTRTGAALLRQAEDDRYDLVVAGGCGHPRWRDDFYGGITTTLLSSATMPVLLAR